MAPSIDQLLTIACSKGASDLHIKAGSFPFMRINGELQPNGGSATVSRRGLAQHGFLDNEQPPEAAVSTRTPKSTLPMAYPASDGSDAISFNSAAQWVWC
jgi:hypothetical protein